MGGSYANDSVAAPTGGGVFPLSENLVIMAVCLHRCIGLATYISEVAEISVFDSMQDRSMEDELQPLHLALSLHSPNVVLVGENVGAEMKASLAEMTGDDCEIILVSPAWFKPGNLEKNIEELWISGMSQDLGAAARKHYILSLLPVAASDEVLASLGALLSCIYAQRLLGMVEVLSGEKLHMLQSFTQFSLKEHLQFDIPTLSALQIFAADSHPSNFIAHAKEGLSLYTLLNHCCTLQGKRMLKNWLLCPITDIREIQARQDEVEYLLGLPSEVLNSMQDILSSMKSLPTVLKQIISSQGCGRTKIEHLRTLHRSIAGGMELVRHCFQILEWRVPRVKLVSIEGVVGLDQGQIIRLLQALNKTLEIDPNECNDGPKDEDFFVAAGVSQSLDDFKAMYYKLPGILDQFLRKELSRIPSALVRKHDKAEWTLVHLPHFGFVIKMGSLLAPDLKDVLQDFEFVSEFCKTFFLYKSKSARLLDDHFGNLHSKILDLETAILSQFTFEIMQIPLWQHLVQKTARLDVVVSLASCARAYGLTRPQMTTESVLKIHNGRHVLNEHTVNEAFIPNDTTFLEDAERIHIVTGPNFSGKTVYAKQVALIVYMAHMGSFVPADAAVVGVCDRVMTRIDSIDASSVGQSSFMIDLTQVLNTLRNATSRSLVLLDEFGRGTNSSDGFGLFFSIINAFAQMPYPPRVIACTHFSCAKYLERVPRHVHVSFKKMECFIERTTDASPAQTEGTKIRKVSSDSNVIYLYRLVSGISDNSLGIFCAKLAGLCDSIWGRAYDILTLRSTSGGKVDVLESAKGTTEEFMEGKLGELLEQDLSPSANLESVKAFLRTTIT